MKKINILLAFLLMVSFSLTAQKPEEKFFSKNTKSAEKSFNESKFFDAVMLFEKAYPKAKGTKEKGFITYHIAVASQYIGDNKKAKENYERALRFKYEKSEPDLYVRLAQMQMQDEQYKEAKRNFDMALKADPNDLIAKKGLKGIDDLNEILANPTKHKVQAVKELNSEYFDWSISQFDRRGEEFLFSSTRKAAVGSITDVVANEEYTDIFVTRADRNGNFGEPKSIGSNINTKDHEASAVMYNNGKSILFTRCRAEKNKVIGCQIYTADQKGNNWSDPLLIPLTDSLGYSAGHPATDQRGTFVVFSSDMPGGRGGKDLWISEYDKRQKTWGKPENLGTAINTPGDEKFPTIGPEDALYFSSNGLPGIGGLDIYKATKIGTSNKWTRPENMGIPINSARDDHGIIFNRNTTQSGFFSSSRMGKNEMDQKSDIFKFDLPECALTIKGRVRDQETKEPLAGASVTLIGSNGTTATIKADSEGNFEFGKRGTGRYVNKDVNYTLEYQADKYLRRKSKRTTVGDFCNEIFYEDVELLCAIGCKPIVMPEVQYVFAKAELLINSQVNSGDSLLFLYNVMLDNPTIKVQLEAHTDCRGSDAANAALSQRRAQTCVDYLISKGIDRSRLVAKGFGEGVPRVINEAGTEKTLDCDMITGLKSSNPGLFEKYHQLNRRTTFSVIPEEEK